MYLHFCAMSESDPKTFYYYFRPIAVMCKCMGLFPIQNASNKDARALNFSRCSLANLYSILVFVVNFAVVWYFSGFAFVISNFESAPNQIVLAVILVRSSLCFFLCVSSSHNLPKLLQTLDGLDRKMYSTIFKENVPLFVKFPLIFGTIIPLLIMSTFAICSFIESTLLIHDMAFRNATKSYRNKAVSYSFGLLSTWQIVPLVVYIFLAAKIKTSFVILNQKLSKTLIYFCLDDIEESIKNLRFLHMNLTRAVYELGEFYGPFMAVDQLCVITMIVVNVNSVLFSKKMDQIHLTILTLINIFVVLVAIVVSDKIKESGHKSVALLQAISFNKLPEACQKEIQMFMVQIIARPVEVSAAGYFIIDKAQVPSILSSIAAYLIVWMQFTQTGKLEKVP